MKKLLPAVLVVVVLAVAGAAVYMWQKPGLDARAASAAAGFLPADTLLLATLPDPGQAAADWRTTDLYKIWAEPQVQAFLAKPLSKLPMDKGTAETWEKVARLDPKNLFVALTALDEKNNQPHFVAGFQFKGSEAEVNELLTEPKNQLRQKSPGGKADLINYQGHLVETFDLGEGNMLASVYLGSQYLVSNDLALLKVTIDRFEHHGPAKDATLDKEADFQAVSAKLPKNHATLLFVRPQTFLGKIYLLAAASGQNVDPAQRAEADKLKAAGATTSIEQGKIRDTIYVLAPGMKWPEHPLQLSGLALTTVDTLFYSASLLNLDGAFRASGNGAGSGGPADLVGNWLKQQGLSLEQLHTAFGQELTVQLDWPAGNAQPFLSLSLDVRDPAAAAKVIDGLTHSSAGGEGWQTTPDNGVVLHSLPMAGGYLNLTVTNTDKHLILSLNAEGARALVKQEKAGGANFTGGEAYQHGVSTLPKADRAFGYLDSKAFFERLYGVLKPAAMFGGTLMYPQMNDYVELGKLPDGEVISKHLSPIVLSQSSDDQGTLMESVGPVTFLQAGVGIGGLGAAAAFPTLQKQYGLFGQPASGPGVLPGSGSSPAPDATPAESP